MDTNTQLKQASEFLYLCLSKRQDVIGSVSYSEEDDCWEVDIACENCRVGYFPDDDTALFSYANRFAGAYAIDSKFEEGEVGYLAEKAYKWFDKYA